MILSTYLAAILLASLPAAQDGAWETLADGSMGRVTEFTGVGGVVIPAYIRKPPGDGPFPVVVLLHGGRYGKGATLGMGRSARPPFAEFLKAGWAVYSIDYRPHDKIVLDPVEIDDSVEAIKALRRLPFVDKERIGLLGGSHGANVSSRVISRVEARGAVLCAPAALDLIEVKKAAGRGEPVVPILKRLIADMEAEHKAKAEEIAKDPAKYGYRSAITEAAQVRCPILIINGRNDDNSPVSVIDAYVNKLRAAGKEVETYLPKNGPHGFYFGRPDIPESQEAARRALAFFQKRFAQEPKRQPPAVSQRPPGPRRPMTWVDADKTEPEGTKYKTFHSATIDADASYLIYLPPDYEARSAARYPVLYHLHASGGTPRSGTDMVRRLNKAIRAGLVAPLIIVMPNAMRGETMYSDTKDGKYPVESVLIRDFIPHVDATYRTLATRAGRAVAGFSMGGFGAAHLGFKYPELFGVISIEAPALLGPELTAATPTRAWARLFPAAMGSDLDYFRANDPFALVAKNADALRDRTVIRIVMHIESENWLAPRCEELHRLLMQHTIPHQFHYLSNVKSHNRAQVLDTMGDAGLMFFSTAFARLGARP